VISIHNAYIGVALQRLDDISRFIQKRAHFFLGLIAWFLESAIHVMCKFYESFFMLAGAAWEERKQSTVDQDNCL